MKNMFSHWLNLVFPPKKHFIAGSLFFGFLVPLIVWGSIYLQLSELTLTVVCIVLLLLLLGCALFGCAVSASRNKDLGLGWFSIGFILAGLTLPLLPVPKGTWTWTQSCYIITGGLVLLLVSVGFGLYRCFWHN